MFCLDNKTWADAQFRSPWDVILLGIRKTFYAVWVTNKQDEGWCEARCSKRGRFAFSIINTKGEYRVSGNERENGRWKLQWKTKNSVLWVREKQPNSSDLFFTACYGNLWDSLEAETCIKHGFNEWINLTLISWWKSVQIILRCLSRKLPDLPSPSFPSPPEKSTRTLNIHIGISIRMGNSHFR